MSWKRAGSGSAAAISNSWPATGSMPGSMPSSSPTKPRQPRHARGWALRWTLDRPGQNRPAQDRAGQDRPDMMRLAYRTATDLAGPLLRRHLASRAISGTEEPSRIEERFAIPGVAPPARPLDWL